MFGRGMERAFVPSDQLGKGARPHRKAPDSPGVSTSKRLPARRGQRRPGRACSQTSPGLFPCRTFPCQRVPGRVGGAYWDGDRDKKQKAKEPERMISERSGRVQFTPRDKRCTGRDQRCAELESKTRRQLATLSHGASRMERTLGAITHQTRRPQLRASVLSNPLAIRPRRETISV